MDNENQVVKVEKKSSAGLIATIIILIIIIFCLGGYIVYDKFISNNTSNTKVEEKESKEKIVNLSDEEITKFINDGGTQPLLGIYYSSPKEIINLTSENESNHLSAMRAMEYCVEQTQSGVSISDDEKKELTKKYNKDFNLYDENGAVAEYSFNTSAKASTIQKIFEEKTGYKLTKEEMKNMAGDVHYLEKYDKYYYWVSDAFISDKIEIHSITKENNLYKVKYSFGTYGEERDITTATLKYNTTTKSINIISNQK